jgi:hypothetical protein
VRAAKATLFLFLSTECPVSNAYTSRIVRLAGEYPARGVRVFGVSPNDHETADVVTRYAAERGYRFPIVKDKGGALAARLGARMTPEAVVLDSTGRVRYRGRIDDSKDTTKVHSQDLRAALDAVLAGKPVAVARTEAFGCAIQSGTASLASQSPKSDKGAATSSNAVVTYAGEVAPILYRNCVTCHRKGEVAPFALETYPQARAWARAIKTFTASRKMPPWKADSNGEFHSERRLTDAEIATLAAWADAGAPMGDARRLPPLPQFAAGWKLGTPDVVVEMPETYELGPDGRDVYQCFVIPTSYSEDRWVAAIEVAPGNRRVVHHVIGFLDTSGTARKLDAADSAPGYTNPTPGNAPGFTPAGLLGGWAPGNDPARLPPGVGTLLPKGADIVMEVHYHRNGKPELDRTRLGIHFVQGPVEKRLRMDAVINRTFRIPPGDADHLVRGSAQIPQNITVLGVTPHMHQIGRSMTAKAVLPDGTVRPLIHVPDWDFNWQLTYGYKEPVKLPDGTRIEVSARYDNSSANPHNPSKPPREVTWGEQTTDEMFVFFFAYTVDAEQLTRPASDAETPAGPPVNVAGAWALTMATPAGEMKATLTLEQEGETLRGTYQGAMGPPAQITGGVRGSRVTFKIEAKEGERSFSASFDGKLTDSALSGAWEFGAIASGKWTAARKPEP